MLGVKTIPNNFTIGLVIGTYGSPFYIKLFLESAKRHFPKMPILVHDDCSGMQAPEGCDFYTNEKSYGHGAGDITVLCNGLKWAKSKNIDVLVKMSRRFIPFFNWEPQLRDVVAKTQHFTYANECTHFKFPFRSECFGMYVPAWLSRLETLKKLINNQVQVEFDVMKFVMEFRSPTCYLNENYIARDINGRYYGVWEEIGDNRMQRVDNLFWHDCYHSTEYYKKAREYGIECLAEDFVL